MKAVLTNVNSVPESQIPVGQNGQGADANPSAIRSRHGKVRLGRKSEKRLLWILALTVGIAGLWQVYHWQVSSGFDLFPGPRGDTRLSAYLIEHWYQVLIGRADWRSPAMFYPVKGTLGYSDIYLAYVPLYSVLRLWGDDIFLALSWTVIVLSYLNFIACFGLLDKVLGFSAAASCAGAMFFAFNNPKLAQTDHLQLQPVLLLPVIAALVILFFIKAESLSAKAAFGLLTAAALCLNLQLLTSFYIGWFFIFWCFLFFGLSCLFQQSRSFLITALRPHLPSVVSSAIIFVVTLVPFLLVYLPAAISVPPYGILPQYIPEMKSYLLMADGNYIWGAVADFILRQTGNGPDWGRRIGIGLVPSVTWMAISVFGLLAIKQYAIAPAKANGADEDDHGCNRGYLFLGLMIMASNLLIIIGLQYRGQSLWNYVYFFLPGAKAVRAVARYTIVLTLPMAIAFAFIVQQGIQSVSRLKSGLPRWSLGAALLAATIFGLFEQLNSGDGQFFSISAEKNRLEKLAAKLPENCSSFYVAARVRAVPDGDAAFENQQYMHDAMLISQIRGVPTLNGRSGKSPPGWSLRNVRASDYELNARRWIEINNIRDNVCRLEVDK